MKLVPLDPPRTFAVGHNREVEIKDCGRLELSPDEQVTFVTPSGSEYDVVRKSWGYYATPSLNHRLPAFGLRPALVRSGDRIFLLLVEAGKEDEFSDYLGSQKMELLCWLHDEAMNGAIDVSDFPASKTETRNLELASVRCSMCDAGDLSLVFQYDAPPQGETIFRCSPSEKYHREIWQCRLCGHFLNLHEMALERLYQGAYVEATYGEEGLAKAFRRIMALPPERSDNTHRVKRVVEYMRERFQASAAEFHDGKNPKMLDVGSGLCVFLKRMKDEGWECTALDPDPRAVDHARTEVGVCAICGDFVEMADLGAYNLITFNKVFEHVEDPLTMLRKSRCHLQPGGVVYVEVPDGEAAAIEGAGREEFFIEHRCVFSLASLGLLAAQAGFTVGLIERLHEPSGKYTLRAFLQ